ncbi:MAG TPA: hypothetical protein VLA32_00070 [Anaerolineales bacterium]|jgi:hypothetical protein|nr:hypothetical protein [Anaerolineales bacterium]
MVEGKDIGIFLEAKKNYRNSLISLPNVNGVGVGYKVSDGKVTDELSVVCLVTKKTSDLPPGGMIPAQIDGIVTDVIQVGEIVALSNTGRYRPAPGGVSIGHYSITAGTLGVVVRDRSDGTRLILSNNHVLANSNDANLGDAILQPGPADGGQLATDTIAHLERFEPIVFSSEPGTCSLASLFAQVGNAIAKLLASSHRVQVVRQQAATNLVDAALARPIADSDVLDDIIDIGPITGTVPPALGMPVRKSGRTTGFTTGTINAVDATIDVSYGAGRTARFEGQLVAGGMSQGGDSGSLVVDGNSNNAVGLLFAGSTSTTIFSPIQVVLDLMDVNF